MTVNGWRIDKVGNKTGLWSHAPTSNYSFAPTLNQSALYRCYLGHTLSINIARDPWCDMKILGASHRNLAAHAFRKWHSVWCIASILGTCHREGMFPEPLALSMNADICIDKNGWYTDICQH